MGLTYGGVSVDVPTTGGGNNSSSDDSGSSIWTDIIKTLPGTLVGASALLNAANGKTPAVTYVQGGGSLGTVTNNTWIYLGIGLVVLVVLMVAMRK